MWERHCANGTVGTAPWERHHENGTIGTALWEQHRANGSNFFIISMIQMIYFDGSMGTGGEGQQFFYFLFQKIFYIL